MPRVSLRLAVFVGAVFSVEAFLGGMFVQSRILDNQATDPVADSSAQTFDPTLVRRLDRTTLKLTDLETEIKALRAQVTQGFVRDLDLTITESQTAYPLVEPKLMISVDALHGGPVLAHFGTETHFFMVGQRVDFRVRDCYCYLLLRESVRDRAVFHFGCERKNPDSTPLEVEHKTAPPAANDPPSERPDVTRRSHLYEGLNPVSARTYQRFFAS